MFSESIKSAVSSAGGESSRDIDGMVVMVVMVVTGVMGAMGVILDLDSLLKNSPIFFSYCIFGCRLSTPL